MIERVAQVSQVGGGRCWLAVGADSMANTKPISTTAMNGITELVPGHLLSGGMLGEFITWANKYILEDKHRKYLALEYCKVTGLVFSRELAKRLMIELYP